RAAQRKSRSVIADETWRQSTCPETYQKHAPVTSTLAAMIAAFSTLPRCDGRGGSNSLATLVLIRLRPLTCATATTCPGSSDKRRCGMVMAETNAKFKQ